MDTKTLQHTKGQGINMTPLGGQYTNAPAMRPIVCFHIKRKVRTTPKHLRIIFISHVDQAMLDTLRFFSQIHKSFLRHDMSFHPSSLNCTQSSSLFGSPS